MENRPFFSVIIPLYNKEDFIESCVESVLNQSFKDFEVVLINDGSTDQSLQKLTFAQNDQRFKLVSQNNKGRCIARNTGIENAIGKWYCFLDADDEFYPEHLQTLFDFINGFPEFKVVCTKEKGGPRILPGNKARYNRTPFTITFKDFLRENPISINQCAFKADFVLNFPDERFPISEDWYYLRKTTARTNIYGVNKITVNVNMHAMRTMYVTKVEEIVKWNLYGAHKVVEDVEMESTFQKQILGSIYLLASNLLLNEQGHRVQAKNLIVKSFKYFPFNLRVLLFKALYKLIVR